MCFGTNNEAPTPLGFRVLEQRGFDAVYPPKPRGEGLARGGECSGQEGDKI